jgi:hypothetical protein
MRIPSLGNHVRDIVFDRSQPKMSRIDTTRIVSSRAIVQDPESVWDRAMVNLPRHAVSADLISFLGIVE